MNIYTPPGDAVRFTNRGGRIEERENANNILDTETIYTVKSIYVDNWNSTVYLEGQDSGFNTVMFENVKAIQHG